MRSPVRALACLAVALSLDCSRASVGAESTLNVAGGVAAPLASQPEVVPAETLDLASLANFAQMVAEEIQGQPVDGRVTDPRPFRPITEVTIGVAMPQGTLPGDPRIDAGGVQPRAMPEFGDARLWGGWAHTNFEWSATRLCHRPMYFEEVNLERYGYTVSPVLQPLISGAHFFLTIPVLPYKMTVQCPRECVYTLGYYRAGSPAPRRWHHMDLVWDPTAITVQGLVVTGLVFAIP